MGHPALFGLSSELRYRFKNDERIFFSISALCACLPAGLLLLLSLS